MSIIFIMNVEKSLMLPKTLSFSLHENKLVKIFYFIAIVSCTIT